MVGKWTVSAGGDEGDEVGCQFGENLDRVLVDDWRGREFSWKF